MVSMTSPSSRLRPFTNEELRCVARFLRAENKTPAEIVERVNKVRCDTTTDIRDICELCDEFDVEVGLHHFQEGAKPRFSKHGLTVQEWMFRDVDQPKSCCQVSLRLAFVIIDVHIRPIIKI